MAGNGVDRLYQPMQESFKPSRRLICRMLGCCRRRFEILLESLLCLAGTGSQNSEYLHAVPLKSRACHYLLRSPQKPVSAEEIPGEHPTMLSVLSYIALSCIAAFQLYPVNSPAGEAPDSLRDGALPSVQGSRNAGKIAADAGAAADFVCLRRTPTAHEYFSIGRKYARGRGTKLIKIGLPSLVLPALRASDLFILAECMQMRKSATRWGWRFCSCEDLEGFLGHWPPKIFRLEG